MINFILIFNNIIFIPIVNSKLKKVEFYSKIEGPMLFYSLTNFNLIFD